MTGRVPRTGSGGSAPKLGQQNRAGHLCHPHHHAIRLGSARGKPTLGAWLAPLLDWRGLCQTDPHPCMKPVALDDNAWCFPSREGHFTAGASFQQTLESCCKRLAPDTGGTNAFRTDCHKSLHCETPAPGLES